MYELERHKGPTREDFEREHVAKTKEAAEDYSTKVDFFECARVALLNVLETAEKARRGGKKAKEHVQLEETSQIVKNGQRHLMNLKTQLHDLGSEPKKIQHVMLDNIKAFKKTVQHVYTDTVTKCPVKLIPHGVRSWDMATWVFGQLILLSVALTSPPLLLLETMDNWRFSSQTQSTLCQSDRIITPDFSPVKRQGKPIKAGLDGLQKVGQVMTTERYTLAGSINIPMVRTEAGNQVRKTYGVIRKRLALKTVPRGRVFYG